MVITYTYTYVYERKFNEYRVSASRALPTKQFQFFLVIIFAVVQNCQMSSAFCCDKWIEKINLKKYSPKTNIFITYKYIHILFHDSSQLTAY